MGQGRFLPPDIHAGRHLIREDLITFARDVLEESGRLCAIAPAGQGKSQFSAQLAANCSCIWLSCDVADADPSVLATDLLLAAASGIPEWEDHGLRTRALKAEFLLKGTDSFAQDFYTAVSNLSAHTLIVLDDLHLVACPENHALLKALAKHRPNGIQLLWLSRSLTETLAASISAGDFPRISSDRLAMSQEEITRLYRDVYKIAISGETARRLYRVTHGWTMGVVSARRKIHRDGSFYESEIITHDLSRFFHDAFLGRLTGLRRNAVLCFSMLERIPVAMIEALAPDPFFPSLLRNQVEEGLFLQKAGPEAYAFHHLIQDYLKQIDELELSRKHRQDFLCSMSRWHLKEGMIIDALTCVVLSKEAQAVGDLINSHWADLIGVREDARIALTLELFDQPENYPGLALALSFFNPVETNPEKTSMLLHAAAAGFEKAGNYLGELRAVVLMIRRRLFGSPLFEAPEILFERMNRLLKLTESRLCLADRLFSALAWGHYGILHAFSSKMVREKVLPLLSEQTPPAYISIRAELIAILCYAEAMTGRHRSALDLSETGYGLVSDPDLSTWSHFYLRMARANILGLCGIEAAFVMERTRLFSFPAPLLELTLGGPFMGIWEICFAIRKGRYKEAGVLADTWLKSAGLAADLSLRGEYMHYHAYAMALCGEKETALECAQASAAAQSAGGNSFFKLMNQLVTGTVYALCGEYNEAENKLEAVLNQELIAEEIGLREAASWVMALVLLRCGKKEEARRLLDQAMGLSELRQSPHFLLAPSWMTELLEFAIQSNIYALHAEKIGREAFGLAFDAKEKAYPMLQAGLFGSLTLLSGDKVLLGSDFSPLHRSLLELLILTPGHSLEITVICERLWPKVMVSSARTSLDTTLLRLRRVLRDRLGKQAAMCLALNNGMLTLSPIRVDVFTFLELIAKANSEHASGRLWMAETYFVEAATVAGHSYRLGVCESDEARVLSRLVQSARERMELAIRSFPHENLN